MKDATPGQSHLTLTAGIMTRNMKHSFLGDLPTTTRKEVFISRFSRNSEVNASEFLENPDEMFSQYTTWICYVS